MISIVRLQESVDICKETGLDDKNIVNVFTVYNHLEHLESYMQTLNTTLPPFGRTTYAEIEEARARSIERLKNDLRISNTASNTHNASIQR